ncbi:DUF3263 domain-containing protein [Streptomyces sp. NPDC048248]|uniref:DUF3263 domain-containing protein n=1 Tax=Streptomyces sp. NPDC048248 TaxID=3365523 RepID=UPI00371E9DD0
MTSGPGGAGRGAGGEAEAGGSAAGADAAAVDGPGITPLSAQDEAVLAVERRSWPGPGAKERVVRERLGISPTRYYQLLNALLDDPRALAHDPVTINRLRRVRDARRARR